MDQPLGRQLSATRWKFWNVLRSCVATTIRSPAICVSFRSNSPHGCFFLADKCASVDAGRNLAEEMLVSGKALAKFKEMLRLQGGG